MAKLNQIIAVANGKKSNAQAVLTQVHHKVQKWELLSGISRSYRPKDDDGERLPPENKNIQYNVATAIGEATTTLGAMFNAVATQDASNCTAKADVVVDGNVILKHVPVTTLLFLEKQLVDMKTFIDKLPTLDTAETWQYSEEADCYATPPAETTKTKRVMKSFEASPATDKHPAQVQVYNEDVIVGYWSQIKFSGAIPAAERNLMLTKVQAMSDAVKFAREQANSIDVVDAQIAKPVLDFVFGEYCSL